jgi:hypothetical protein
VTPRAAVDDALGRARAGELLGPAELAAIFGLGRSQFHKLRREGKWEAFKVRPAIGTRCYSGVLVTRYLAGELVDARLFGPGRKRA